MVALTALGLLGGLVAWLHLNVRGFIQSENKRQDGYFKERFDDLNKRLDGVEAKQDEHESACNVRNERDAARYAKLEAAMEKR